MDKHSFGSWKFWSKWILPVILVVSILLLKFFPSVIERYYSNGLYIGISKLLRIITGWIGISLGDIFYAVLVVKLISWAFRSIKLIIKKQASWKKFGFRCFELIRMLLWIFIWFNFVWGLNYNRLGVAYQLKLEPVKYSKEEVESIVCELVDKVNESRKAIGNDSLLPIAFKEIYATTFVGYKNLALEHPAFIYQNQSIKKSLYSKVSHYMGFTGYYNPFSGEAQVSSDLPNILVPYIACHEVAHQLGYASESEANFVGYLACKSANDKYFTYSVYMDLYKYAARELFLKDLRTTHSWELDSLVRKDFREIRKFFDKKENKVSPVFSSMYNQYLKANQQERGIESYNDVIGLLIAYRNKYGKI
jgi:hypothetical protein